MQCTVTAVWIQLHLDNLRIEHLTCLHPDKMRISIENWLVTYFKCANESYTIFNCCPHDAKTTANAQLCHGDLRLFSWLTSDMELAGMTFKIVITSNWLVSTWSEYKWIENYDCKVSEFQWIAIWNLIRENSFSNWNESYGILSSSFYSDFHVKSNVIHDECWLSVSAMKIGLHVLWFAGDHTKFKSNY